MGKRGTWRGTFYLADLLLIYVFLVNFANMKNETLYIENPSEELLTLLRAYREQKEQKRQELLRSAHLFFPDKNLSNCEQDQQPN